LLDGGGDSPFALRLASSALSEVYRPGTPCPRSTSVPSRVVVTMHQVPHYLCLFCKIWCSRTVATNAPIGPVFERSLRDRGLRSNVLQRFMVRVDLKAYAHQVMCPFLQTVYDSQQFLIVGRVISFCRNHFTALKCDWSPVPMLELYQCPPECKIGRVSMQLSGYLWVVDAQHRCCGDGLFQCPHRLRVGSRPCVRLPFG